MNRGRGACLVGVVCALLCASTASAAEAFSAHGSVEQVYATGLPGGAEASLLDSGGSVVATRSATAEGGVLFRNVPPGDGYRVSSGGETSAPLTVLTTASAPPSTDGYNQTIPEDGHGYPTPPDGPKPPHPAHP